MFVLRMKENIINSFFFQTCVHYSFKCWHPFLDMILKIHSLALYLGLFICTSYHISKYSAHTHTHRQHLKVHIASSWKCNHVAYFKLRLLFLWENAMLKFIILHRDVPISWVCCYFPSKRRWCKCCDFLLTLTVTLVFVFVSIFISSTDFLPYLIMDQLSVELNS